ncbi:hypothetical protein CC80DRAFT_459870 [Byssothecium circinans]|uniref:DNA polymerase V n=1 Tax=Byssothecium circinans TaxID=147558 RepID=A0A6A5UEF8_9PLEO|nr:hypothetical protein CC80DRAFT_459870 [Byssothecium circinans]
MSKKGRKRGREEFQEGAGADDSTKHKRQVTDEKLLLYKLYENLAAESDEVRLEAAQQLIVRLSPENKPAASDVQEVLNRLIRGLCTQRKAARLGFCVTLTELLRQLLGPSNPVIEGLDLNVNSFLKRVERQTKVEGNVAGIERRDHLIGKVFAYKAIMQSSILIEPQLFLQGWHELLDRIYGMARDVPWLREECGLILVQAVESLDTKIDLEPCAQGVVQRLVSFNLVNTPEGVAIWLALKASKYEKVLPVRIWHDNDPLSKKERTRLAKVLRENFRGSSEDGKSEDAKSAAAHPNPSFAWDLILLKVLQMDTDATPDRTDSERSEFARFWLDTVDAHLFGISSTHERKSWGFKLFSKMIGQAPDWAIAALFSPNLMRTLLNQTKKDNRLLHAAALKTWKALQSRAEKSPSSTPSLVAGLTSNNGTADFESPMKAKALEQILLEADDDSLKKIVRYLNSLIIRPDTTEQSVADHRRQAIADLLLSVIRQYKRYEGLIPDVFESDNWLKSTLELMVEHAYFIPSQKAKTRKVPLPPISEVGRKMFQERLSSCLTRLLAVKSESHMSFGLLVIQMIRSKTTASKSLRLVFEAEDTVADTVEKALKNLDDIIAEDSSTGETSTARGFLLLYTFTLLQVYNGDTDAVMMLNDIDSTRNAVLKSVKGSATQGQDGFVEILLSFMGNPRTLFHKIAVEAFTTFAPGLSLEGLQSLTDILDTEETLEGQKQLFAQDDELGDEDEDMEDASDVEMAEGGSSVSDDSEHGSSSGTSSDSEDADDSEEDEELTQFNNMLALTLQTSKPTADGEADDVSSDDSDMDDEQMMALDPHLSNIFKQRSQITGKKERKDAKKNMVQFKSRVLDLLAIFLDKQFSNTLTLNALIPVLRLTRANVNKQLSDKSSKLLRTVLSTHTKQKTELPKPGDIESAIEVLMSIHEEATLGGGAIIHANACSAASLHLVRVLVDLGSANYARAVDVYAESQKRWFQEKKSPMQPVIFSQFLNWSVQFRSNASK